MAFNHGISVTQADTSLSAPVIAASGIPFAVGTAPIHTVGGKANEVIMCGTYAQAAAALGYSGDWKTYTLCEVMVSHFKLFGMAPVVFVNVLDPEKHKKAAEAKSYELKDGKAMLPAEAIKSTVKADAYTEGEDYGLFYSDEGLVLEVLPGGAIPDGTASLNIGFDAADPSMVTEADIIGGFDIAAKRTTGLELIDAVFPKYGIAPDLIIAPGWSGNPAVAAVMGAKAMNINGTFEAKALIDADSKTVNHYMDVAAWKKKNNIFSKTQILCWPMVKQGGQTFHMSTQLAGRMAATDADNDGCPAESPSNKPLMMDRTSAIFLNQAGAQL